MNRLIKFFQSDHLAQDLQPVVERFEELADWIDQSLPESAEKTTALRKLLESKDCAVRAKLELEDARYR